MFILHIKKLVKNRALCLLIVIFFVLLSYYLYCYTGSKCYIYLQGAICKMLLAIPYVFFVFIFLSYEVFYSYSKSNFNEILCSRRISIKYQRYDFLILLLLNIIVTIMMFHSQILFYHNRNCLSKELISYSLRISILFWGLVNFFGILVGWIASAIKSKLVGMCLLLALYYLFDQSFFQLLMLIADKNFSLWKFSTLFGISGTELIGGINDCYYLLSAENIHIYRILFWIFLALFVVFKLAKSKIRLVWGIFAIAAICLFYVPSGASYSIPVFNCFDRWYGEQFYYPMVKGDTIEDNGLQKSDFIIDNYDITLKVDDILKATARMKLKNSSLDSYEFTLYHSYHVTKVTNDSGDNLKYERKGDYLTIYNINKNLSGINVDYQGGSQYFYSTSQGIMLPANFSYFPTPGHKAAFINNSCNTCFTRDVLAQELNFNVTILYNKNLKVYSNLKEKNLYSQDGYMVKMFEGYSNGLSIIGSPYLCKEVVDNVTILYSSLDDINNPTIKDNRERYRELFQKMDTLGHSLDGKTFIVEPDNSHDNYCFASDHIFNQEFKTYEQAVDYYKHGKLYYYLDEADSELVKQVEDAVSQVEDDNGE